MDEILMMAPRGRAPDRRALRRVHAPTRAEQLLVSELAFVWRRCPALADGANASTRPSKLRTSVHARTSPSGRWTAIYPSRVVGIPDGLKQPGA